MSAPDKTPQTPSKASPQSSQTAWETSLDPQKTAELQELRAIDKAVNDAIEKKGIKESILADIMASFKP